MELQRIVDLLSPKVGDEWYNRLIESGVPKSELDEYIRKISRKVTRDEYMAVRTMYDQEHLYDLAVEMLGRGFAICGGIAVSMAFGGRSFIKDLDVFVKDEVTFFKEHLKYVGTNVDICLYENEPWEMFDLDICCVAIWDGRVEVTDQARKAYDSKVCHINIDKMRDADRTLKRCIKYNARYDVKFPVSELLILMSFALEDYPDNLIDNIGA